MKLIKIDTGIYLIVVKEDLKIGDYYIDKNRNIKVFLDGEPNENWLKITHSNVALNPVFDVQPLDLGEVEELVQGYSISTLSSKEPEGNPISWFRGWKDAEDFFKDRLLPAPTEWKVDFKDGKLVLVK